MALEGLPPIDRRDRPELDRLRELLGSLYAEELAGGPNAYLAEHGRPAVVDGDVRTFLWYRRFLAPAEAVLDWGCQHGAVSVLVREALGPAAALHACDFRPAGAYPVFGARSGARYTQLETRRELPYDDGSFDVVVGAGVLEHVASDIVSLLELHRVLRPGGRLIVTELPNRLSLAELRLRRAGAGHQRRYGRRGARWLLEHTGFRPITPVLYQTFAWERQARWLLGDTAAARSLAAALRVFAPVHVVRASTLCVAAERVDHFA